jgi:hypothetical protein
MGGILCYLDTGNKSSEDVIVSITHLAFNQNTPLTQEIKSYQKHRVKKLKRQNGRGY